MMWGAIEGVARDVATQTAVRIAQSMGARARYVGAKTMAQAWGPLDGVHFLLLDGVDGDEQSNLLRLREASEVCDKLGITLILVNPPPAEAIRPVMTKPAGLVVSICRVDEDQRIHCRDPRNGVVTIMGLERVIQVLDMFRAMELTRLKQPAIGPRHMADTGTPVRAAQAVHVVGAYSYVSAAIVLSYWVWSVERSVSTLAAIAWCVTVLVLKTLRQRLALVITGDGSGWDRHMRAASGAVLGAVVAWFVSAMLSAICS